VGSPGQASRTPFAGAIFGACGKMPVFHQLSEQIWQDIVANV
jgi:hypothetical protein